MIRKIVFVDKIPLKPAPGSNVILKIGYREDTTTLRVKYCNGRILDYTGITPWDWDAISKNPQKIDELVLIISTNYQGREIYEK